MAILTISIPDDLGEFVNQRVRETRHASPAEYIQSLIAADQGLREQQRLEKQLIQGLDSGIPQNIPNLDEHFAQKKNALLARMKQAARP